MAGSIYLEIISRSDNAFLETTAYYIMVFFRYVVDNASATMVRIRDIRKNVIVF